MRLMGAANRDIAYCPFAPSVVPFGSSQFQEWPLFARCCGLCEIDVGDNQLSWSSALLTTLPYGSTTTDWPANVTSPSLPTRLHMTMATWFCMAWTRIFHRNGFDGSASVFGTDARRRHDDQAAPRNAHVRMPSRGSLK